MLLGAIELVCPVAPDVLAEFGIIDEGIAVALNLADGIVALLLYLVERVGFCPFEHEVINPRTHQQRTVGVNGQEAFCGCPERRHVAVASSHVEICPCEVALPLVGRLPNRDDAVGSVTAALAHFYDAVGVGHRAVHDADGVVALASVGCGIGRVEVEEVAERVVLQVPPPAVCPDVFDVHASHRAHVGVEVAHHVAVAVAHLQAVHLVGLPESAPCLAEASAVAKNGCGLDDVVEGCLKLRASQAFSLAVVLFLGGCLRTLTVEHWPLKKGQEQEKYFRPHDEWRV